jgi:hypothetical protein
LIDDDILKQYRIRGTITEKGMGSIKPVASLSHLIGSEKYFDPELSDSLSRDKKQQIDEEKEKEGGGTPAFISDDVSSHVEKVKDTQKPGRIKFGAIIDALTGLSHAPQLGKIQTTELHSSYEGFPLALIPKLSPSTIAVDAAEPNMDETKNLGKMGGANLPFFFKGSEALMLQLLQLSSSLPVKVHVGGVADRMAKYYGADAFAVARNIFLPKDAYEPFTARGFALLVHELSHVVQQERDPSLRSGNISLSRYSSLEKEAQDEERHALELYSMHKGRKEYHSLSISSYENNTLRNSLFTMLPFITGIHYPSNNYAALHYPNFLAKDDDNSSSSADSNNPLLLTLLQEGDETRGSKNKELQELQYLIPESKHSNYLEPSSSSSVMTTTRKDVSISATMATSKITGSLATPLFAERGRAIDSPAAAIAQQPSAGVITASNPPPKIDLARLADQVYDIIARKIQMERERRGIR